MRVCDQGPGVLPHELDRLFQPFFRGSSRDIVQGHGLGLAIAERIVRSHHGSIRAHNRDAGGLCVEITLPLAAREAASGQ